MNSDRCEPLCRRDNVVDATSSSKCKRSCPRILRTDSQICLSPRTKSKSSFKQVRVSRVKNLHRPSLHVGVLTAEFFQATLSGQIHRPTKFKRLWSSCRRVPVPFSDEPRAHLKRSRSGKPRRAAAIFGAGSSDCSVIREDFPP